MSRVIPPGRPTGLVGGEVLSHEAIAEAVRAGYVPVYAADTRTRQEKRRDERQKIKAEKTRRNAFHTRRRGK